VIFAVLCNYLFYRCFANYHTASQFTKGSCVPICVVFVPELSLPQPPPLLLVHAENYHLASFQILTHAMIATVAQVLRTCVPSFVDSALVSKL